MAIAAGTVTIGDQIRTMRAIRNVSQAELAKRTGLSQYLISCFETEQALPTQAQLALIREELGWPAEAEAAFAILAGGDDAHDS